MKFTRGDFLVLSLSNVLTSDQKYHFYQFVEPRCKDYNFIKCYCAGPLRAAGIQSDDKIPRK